MFIPLSFSANANQKLSKCAATYSIASQVMSNMKGQEEQAANNKKIAALIGQAIIESYGEKKAISMIKKEISKLSENITPDALIKQIGLNLEDCNKILKR